MSAIIEFIQDPLTIWFASCLDIPLLGVEYHALTEGLLLHKIFLEINPNPLFNTITYSGSNPMIRTRNLKMVIKNIQLYYEEKLGHVLSIKPDAIKLGQDPEMYTQEATLLLLLLLGAAVQCPNKVKFIKKSQAQSNDVQACLIQYIQKVTELMVLKNNKSRTRELEEDKVDLMETIEVLEEHLAAQTVANSNLDKLIEELENYKQGFKELIVKYSAACDENKILREENAYLRSMNNELLSSCSSSTDTASECDDIDDMDIEINNSPY